MGDAKDLLCVDAPLSLKRRLIVPKKLLCGPGPTNMHSRVRDALSLPLLGHMHKEFAEIMDELQAGTKYLFQTLNKMTFALAGTGHAGMECCLTNLVEPGDKVCIVKSGIWGERCGDMVTRLQGIPCFVESGKLGNGIGIESLEKVLLAESPRLLYVAQGESSTGVQEDIAMIASASSTHKCIVIVDTVASLGGVPFKMDEWNVGCVFTGSQKVLGMTSVICVFSYSS